VTGPDSWQTPQIREALARLENAEVALDQTILSAKQLDQATPKSTLSKQDVEAIEAYARTADAPKDLRELQKRVDSGELTWGEIASSQHFADPKVQAALSTGVNGMRQAYTLIEEGQSLDEIIESPPAPPRQPDPRDEEPHDYDDPDDDDGPVFRGITR
jgi:hypothetical protein